MSKIVFGDACTAFVLFVFKTEYCYAAQTSLEFNNPSASKSAGITACTTTPDFKHH
jgi:hypothetical protein